MLSRQTQTSHACPDHTGQGNAWDELQTEAKAVAAQQRTAELTEWLGCAKIALQVWLHLLADVFPALSICSYIGGLGLRPSATI